MALCIRPQAGALLLSHAVVRSSSNQSFIAEQCSADSLLLRLLRFCVRQLGGEGEESGRWRTEHIAWQRAELQRREEKQAGGTAAGAGGRSRRREAKEQLAGLDSAAWSGADSGGGGGGGADDGGRSVTVDSKVSRKVEMHRTNIQRMQHRRQARHAAAHASQAWDEDSKVAEGKAGSRYNGGQKGSKAADTDSLDSSGCGGPGARPAPSRLDVVGMWSEALK